MLRWTRAWDISESEPRSHPHLFPHSEFIYTVVGGAIIESSWLGFANPWIQIGDKKDSIVQDSSAGIHLIL